MRFQSFVRRASAAVAAATVAGVVSPVSVHAASKPPVLAVTSFSSSGTSLPASGGPITLTAHVTKATNCTFSVTPSVASLPQTKSCATGSASVTVALPATTTPKAATYTFSLVAAGTGTLTAKSKAVVVTVAGQVAPTVTTFTSSATTVAAGGGQVTLKASVKHATSCVFSVTPTVPGFPLTTSCSSGTASASVAIPANALYTAAPYVFSMTANGAGTLSAAAKPITVTQAAAPKSPIITSISPTVGRQIGGTIVTITGVNLATVTAVKFGSVAAAITSKTATSITVTSPPLPTGTVDITVTNPLGTSPITQGDQFAYSVAIQPCDAITQDAEILPGTYSVNCSITVPRGVTVTIDPGVTLKMGSGINVSGTLNAIGTSLHPITFTSINDNSVGGATGSGSPSPGDWGGITTTSVVQNNAWVTPGVVNLSYLHLSYAQLGFQGSYLTSNPAALSVTNCVFSHIPYAAITVTSSAPVLENNQFVDVNQSTPGGNNYWKVAIFISDNVGTGVQINPNTIYGNNGGDGNLIELNGPIASGTLNPGTLIPYTYDHIDVPASSVVNIPAGEVLKFGIPSLTPQFGQITVEGTLNVNGTQANPVVMTSVWDSTVGGNSMNIAGSPSPGDWGGITISGSGVLDLNGASIEYANVGISASGSSTSGLVSGIVQHVLQALNISGGSWSVRGIVSDYTKAIQACDWSSTQCSVDATHVYWGTASGPPVTAIDGQSSASVCGAVSVSPFDSAPGVTSSEPLTSFASTNCSGAPTPDQVANQADAAFQDSIASENAQCSLDSNAPPDPSPQKQCLADVRRREACYNAALGIAGAAIDGAGPVPVSEAELVQNVGEVLAVAFPVVGTVVEAVGVGLTVYGIVKMYEAFAKAANSC